MAKLADDDVRLRLADAVRDVQYLLGSGATKNQVLVGTQGRRGLNHVNELFMMLPDSGETGEFRVRE